VLRQVRAAAVTVTEGSGASLLMYLVVVAFLAIQDRIDRNDPKLALAPVGGERDLPFDAPSAGDEVR